MSSQENSTSICKGCQLKLHWRNGKPFEDYSFTTLHRCTQMPKQQSYEERISRIEKLLEVHNRWLLGLIRNDEPGVNK